jgi:hypothetical protein
VKSVWVLGLAALVASLIVGCGGNGSPYVPAFIQGTGGGGNGGSVLTLTGAETTWRMTCEAVNDLPVTLRTSQGSVTVTFDFEGLQPQQEASVTPDPANIGPAGTNLNLRVRNLAGARPGDGSFTLIASQGAQTTRFSVAYSVSGACQGNGGD